MEEWRPMPGYDGRYDVSNLGRVRSLDRTVTYVDGRVAIMRGHVLKCSADRTGYIHIALPDGKRRLVHRLIAEAFLGPPDHVRQAVNHKNGIKHDNRIENLEWVSPARNAEHARDVGLNRQHGQNTNLSKYGDQLVSAMRRVHSEYRPPYKKLGELFGVSGCHASEIIRGKTRKRG